MSRPLSPIPLQTHGLGEAWGDRRKRHQSLEAKKKRECNDEA
jgi:hypothetical protein